MYNIKKHNPPSLRRTREECQSLTKEIKPKKKQFGQKHKKNTLVNAHTNKRGKANNYEKQATNEHYWPSTTKKKETCFFFLPKADKYCIFYC